MANFTCGVTRKTIPLSKADVVSVVALKDGYTQVVQANGRTVKLAQPYHIVVALLAAEEE